MPARLCGVPWPSPSGDAHCCRASIPSCHLCFEPGVFALVRGFRPFGGSLLLPRG